ncbi:MAG TPA: glycine--tRNA ligase subunit beta [Elusimicrobia bacterium]|nr:MAG: glycine--tRNA ligase subunit beta [Elusimicrobia bacterium GWD2_63_28]HCC48055.1 glycine--tRNA ligase subunit beta [Elusimicrobiota bacterium]
MLKKDALLEIRIENIPARFVTSAEEQLKKYAAEALKEANLPYEAVEAYGTYKRLVLYISGVPAKTEEKLVKAYGPASRLLKDAAGNYTPQAAGFARSRGTTPDKLGVETVPNKGEVLVFETKIPGRPSVKALAEIFPQIISRLQFPKNMVWESTRFRFARPIRTLLALYGDKPVVFSVAGIKSGRVTVGLSAKGSRQLKIGAAEKYFKALEHANVIVKDEERLEVLRRELAAVTKRMKLEVEADEELLKENLYLVEYPVCVVAGYSQDFLKLPHEFVHLVMKKQLKFFTVADQKGRLQPYFVGVRDGVSKGQRNVEDGFRNVLEARFRDAIFFYTRDLAVPLADFLDKLGAITFQAKLGTMADKTARVEKIAAWLCANGGAAANAQSVAAAAAHVYADLTSNVVREFTELQGVMGGYYAANAGMGETVARAVGEFYWPMSAKSPLPSSVEGAVVSLAGKLDTLASDFAVGLVPTGSEDPHGLRRQALGAVRIVLEKGLRLNLREAVTAAFAALPPEAAAREAAPLLDFIWQRAEAVFAEEGYRFDEIKAVREFFLAGGDLLDCRDRVKDIHALRANPDFAGIAMAFKRAKNILRQAKSQLSGAPDEGVFENAEERALYGEIKAMSGRLRAHVSARDYAKGLSELLSIKVSLDNFFDKVMVMAEDPKVRDNRLNLIKSLVSLVEGVADLSQLQ